MATSIPLRVKRGTRAQLNAAAAAGQLAAGEPYLITDEGRLAIGTGADTYTALAKQGEGGGGTAAPDMRAYAALPASEFSAWVASTANRDALAAWLADPVAGLQASDVNNNAIVANLTGTAGGAALLIGSQRALNLLAANAGQWAKWTASTVLAATRVPVMTSASQPLGTVTRSSANGAYEGWQAFDHTVNLWLPGVAQAGEWVAYQFTQPVHIHSAELTPGDMGGPTGFRLQYSDNGSAWTTAAEVASYTPSAGVKTTHALPVAGRHAHWRLYLLGASGFGSVNELQFLGFA